MKDQENSGPSGASSQIEWLGTAEAARHLGITTRTLYRLVNEGQLPAYQFGRVFRLKQSDVEQFIEDSRIKPGSLDHLSPDARQSAPE